MNSELLPCPFCGSEAEIGENGDNSPNWYVQCADWKCCHLEGQFLAKEKAIAAWNRRQPPALPSLARDDVNEAFKRMAGLADVNDMIQVAYYVNGLEARLSTPPAAQPQPLVPEPLFAYTGRLYIRPVGRGTSLEGIVGCPGLEDVLETGHYQVKIEVYP